MSTTPTTSSIVLVTLAIGAVALAASAQYNGYGQSDSELGKLVRNSARAQYGRQSQHNFQGQHQPAASRPMQYAPTQHNRRQFNADQADLGSNFGPLMGAAANQNGNQNDDDDDGANFGPNFDGPDGDGDSSNSEPGQQAPMNLNQAASGYPMNSQADEGDEAPGYGYGAGDSTSGYTPEGGEFSGLDGLGGDGRRAKSASHLMGSARGIGLDDDAGASQYGPNSAVNSGDADDESRSGYAPDSNDNDNDDE